VAAAVGWGGRDNKSGPAFDNDNEQYQTPSFLPVEKLAREEGLRLGNMVFRGFGKRGQIILNQ